MAIKRKCDTCHKELGEFEGHPEPYSMPATYSFPLPAGGVLLYCDKCYEDRMQGYKEINEIIKQERIDSNKPYERLFEKIKSLFERGFKEISISRFDKGYKIKYKKR